MKNRRSRNTIHKKYRRYRSDIWGRLGVKQRNNFITKLIYDFSVMALVKRLYRVTRKSKKDIKDFFGPSFRKTQQKNFSYQINQRAIQRRVRPNSQRGILLRMRRQISLYYGGGRIRVKTFRRYGRLIAERYYPKTTVQHHFPRTYAAVVESRLDVLLLRSNFVDSIYRARQLIFHRKCRVQGLVRVTNPAVQLHNYQKFTLRSDYAKRAQRDLIKRIKNRESRRFINPPSYLFVNYSLMTAFLIEDPITRLVGFPFSEDYGALASFRKSFRML